MSSYRGSIGKRRHIAFRERRKLFLLSMEGTGTEPTYFNAIKKISGPLIKIKLIPNPKNKSNPKAVLKRLKLSESKADQEQGDELWLIIDRDDWTETDLDQVCRAAQKKGYFIALSNPCFELWLYLHLRKNRSFFDRHACQRALEAVLDGYSPSSKGSYRVNSLVSKVHVAIERAAALDATPDRSWPKEQATRVYKLVQKLVPPA